MIFPFLFMVISSDGPWTKEIRSLDETIKAYEMLEKQENNEIIHYWINRASFNNRLIVAVIKRTYLGAKPISIDYIKSSQNIIYAKGHLLSE